MMLRLIEDHDRIAEGMNDVVVHRLFSAGLTLEVALGLIGEHRASGMIQHAISELDLAIRDVRDIVFDNRRPQARAAPRSDYRASE
jgi:signal transduction histidine kinase